MIITRTMFDPKNMILTIKVWGANGLPSYDTTVLIEQLLSEEDNGLLHCLFANRALGEETKNLKQTVAAKDVLLRQKDKELAERGARIDAKNDEIDKLKKEQEELKKELDKTKSDYRRNNEMFESFAISRDTLLNKKDKEIQDLKAALATAEKKYRSQLTATHNIAEKYNALLQEENVNYKEKYEELKRLVNHVYGETRDCFDDDCILDYEIGDE